MSVLVLSLMVTIPSVVERSEAVRIIDRAESALGRPAAEGDFAVRTTGTRRLGDLSGSRRINDATRQYVLLFYPPDRVHLEETWLKNDFPARMVVVLKGDQAWHREAGETRECTPEQKAILRALTRQVEHFAEMTDYKKYHLSLLPEQKIDGEECVGVRVRSGGRPDLELYFGKQSNFLRKRATEVPGPDGGLCTRTDYLSDYKRFAGRYYATKVVQRFGDHGTVTHEIVKIESVPAAEAKHLFEKP